MNFYELPERDLIAFFAFGFLISGYVEHVEVVQKLPKGVDDSFERLALAVQLQEVPEKNITPFVYATVVLDVTCSVQLLPDVVKSFIPQTESVRTKVAPGKVE